MTTNASNRMLEVREVRKSFGGVKALDGASLTVEGGTVSGLIGPNGAGKSSLFNVITGLTVPDSGDIVLDGEVVTGSSFSDISRRGVGRAFQSPRGFASMTVVENLEVGLDDAGETVWGGLRRGRRRDPAVRERSEGVLDRLAISELRDVPYTELSGGELRLLEIGRHLMRDTKFLLLDEPTAGVIPTMQHRLANVIRGLVDEGTTVLIVEHNLGFVFGLATHVDVMLKGRVLVSGTPHEVQADARVIDAYLGRKETAE
jgi:ABC-type branched-subunit amino acid transport system ATPase component